MITVRYGLVLLVGIAIGVGMQVALAKGPPQKVTITGGDLPAEIEITEDQGVLEALAMMTLEDYTTLTETAPEDISGEGYLITRYYANSGGRFFPFDEVRYYPDPKGGRGHVYYEGIVNGSSEYDHKWFRAREASSALLDEMLGSAVSAPARAQSGLIAVFQRLFATFANAQ